MSKNLAIFGLILSLLVVGIAEKADAQTDDTTGHTTDDSKVIDLRRIDGEYANAQSIYVTSQPHIYLIETGRHRFLVLDERGTRMDSVGNQGFGNYQFDRPLDIDATNGLKIYISDYHNGRIQVFDRRLQYLSTITPPRNHDQFYSYQPTVLTVSESRELFFYETDSGRLVQYNENGELSSTIRIRTDRRLHPPADISTMRGQLLLADSVKDVIHILKPEGQYVQFIGGFENIRSLEVGSDNMWVLSKEKISQLDASGRFRKEFVWKETIDPVDMGIYKGYVFILTSKALWKGRISDQ